MIDVKKKDITLAGCKRILEEAGEDYPKIRVGESAAQELKRILELIGLYIGRQSFPYMQHTGRITLKGSDITEGSKRILALVEQDRALKVLVGKED